jgi:ABC-type sugar transport system ATPase subunit
MAKKSSKPASQRDIALRVPMLALYPHMNVGKKYQLPVAQLRYASALRKVG